MAHLPDLVSDLAVILFAAAIVTLLFKKLKQPVVLGYIIAGILAGPHMPFFPTIADAPNVMVWAEIGVIFLLFALGLEFSFKKLARVGGPASITAVVEIISMMLIGYLVGHAFGWSNMDSIFLGGILSVSSTTIIIRAFEEAGVKGRGFVSLVFGALIVEDLAAIILLVLLSTIAVRNHFEGSEMVASLFKLSFYLILWFLAGILLIPTILKKLKGLLNDETLLVVSTGLCFMMVVLATKAGFSPALGAFIIGSILAETTDAEKIEHLIKPVKDLFAAVFFVSVGTMIDPKLMMEYWVPVVVISLATVFGKMLSTGAGALISGQGLKHSVQTGFSLSQIGEFSFIIAGLGLSLNVTSEFLYPIAVAVSAVTTFTTPYLIRYADTVYVWIEKAMPQRWMTAIDRYSVAAQRVSTTGAWRQLIQRYLVRVSANAVIVAAIFLAVAKYLPEHLGQHIESSKAINGLSLAAAIVFSAPFLWAWLISPICKKQVSELWPDRRYRAPILTLEAARYGSAIALFGFLAPQIVAVKVAILLLSLLVVTMLVVFSKHWKTLYDRIERSFVINLSARDEQQRSQPIPALAPWNAHIAKLEVSPHAEVVGKTLMESRIRERFGVTIALIERGNHKITAPSRNEKLYPYDEVSVIGTDEQVTAFQSYIETDAIVRDDAITVSNYSLKQLEITEHSPFKSRTIRDSGIREQACGLVVGVERDGQRILNPDSTMTIEVGDILWVVGDRSLLRKVEETHVS